MQVELAGILHLLVEDRGSIVTDRSRGRPRLQFREQFIERERRRSLSLAERLHILGPLVAGESPGVAQLTHLPPVARRGATEKKKGALSPTEIVALQDRAGRSIEFLRSASISYSFVRIPKRFGGVERLRLRVSET